MPEVAERKSIGISLYRHWAISQETPSRIKPGHTTAGVFIFTASISTQMHKLKHRLLGIG
jgi:hypothetical protein